MIKVNEWMKGRKKKGIKEGGTSDNDEQNELLHPHMAERLPPHSPTWHLYSFLSFFLSFSPTALDYYTSTLQMHAKEEMNKQNETIWVWWLEFQQGMSVQVSVCLFGFSLFSCFD